MTLQVNWTSCVKSAKCTFKKVWPLGPMLLMSLFKTTSQNHSLPRQRTTWSVWHQGTVSNLQFLQQFLQVARLIWHYTSHDALQSHYLSCIIWIATSNRWQSHVGRWNGSEVNARLTPAAGGAHPQMAFFPSSQTLRHMELQRSVVTASSLWLSHFICRCRASDFFWFGTPR